MELEFECYLMVYEFAKLLLPKTKYQPVTKKLNLIWVLHALNAKNGIIKSVFQKGLWIDE